MKLGIIGAMDIEVALIRKNMHVTNTHTEAGMEFVVGTLAGVDVVLARCGVGKVASAACAQLMVSRFDVTHLLNTGIAGAIDPRLAIGDVVVAEHCVYYDVNVHHYLFAPGQVPGMPPVYLGDAGLNEALMQAAMDVDGAKLLGPMVTGDSFIIDVEQKKELANSFAALCCDMEGAAIAQVAHMNSRPFAVVRIISDLADGNTDDSVDEAVANIAADLVCRAVARLG